ncbi:unnamed protein product [Oikopleura dioica]|uniref:Uncharacterized protein n=1 Tax=Oikopleura dioica TaxID=34765 RepID=E4YXU9_OIKDI|nr:unnamed protein product [Oikopleura dioica]
MFDDAGIDFPPLPEKEPEPEGPPDFWFTLSAGDISEVVETTLNHCQFDQVEHARFVMNLRELVESTSGIVVPKDLPKFIPKPIDVDGSDDKKALENGETSCDDKDASKTAQELLDDEVVSCDEDEFEAE